MFYNNNVPHVLLVDAPINSVAPSLTGLTYNGQTLSVTTGTWDTALSYTYQWQSSSDNGVTYANMSGETSNTVVLDYTGDGLSYRCEVTAVGLHASASTYSNELENWTPEDAADVIFWTDPSYSSSVTDSSGSVQQITSRVGSRKFVMNTASRQPVIGTRTLNGLDVIDFDRASLHRMDAYSFPVDADGDIMFIGLCSIDSVSNSTDSVYSMDASNNDFQFDARTSNQFDGRLLQTGVGSNINITGGPYSGDHIFCVEFDFTGEVKIKVYVDGVNVGETAYTTKLAVSHTLKLMSNRGTNATIDGYASDFIVSNAVNATNRIKHEGYLAHKYDLTSLLDAGHTYKTNPPTV